MGLGAVYILLEYGKENAQKIRARVYVKKE